MPYQRLAPIPRTATSDANGNITFTFPNPPSNLCWTGTLNAPAANSNLLLTAKVAGTPVTSGLGASPFGPIQALAGESIIVTGTGAIPSTQFTCVFNGYSTSINEWVPVFPAVVPAAVQTTVVAGNPNGSSPLHHNHLLVGGSPPVSPEANVLTQGLVAQALKGNANLVYVGNIAVQTSTGFELQPGQNVTLPLSNSNQLGLNGTAAGDGICWIAL